MKDKKKGPDKVQVLETELAQAGANMELLKERLAELEQSLQEVGWQEILGGNDRELSRGALKTINRQARLYFLKNPLIRRAVLTQALYVFGQGVTIKGEDEDVDLVVQRFMDDRKNLDTLTSHQAMMQLEQELHLFGNLCFAFFTDERTGRVITRTIPIDEISRIVTNPEDMHDVWYYLREWTVQTWNPATGSTEAQVQKALYPDWKYVPKDRPDRIGELPIMWDAPVYHVKVNCLHDMQFGVSEVYSAIDWAQAYKQFLENWATIVKAYSRFAWSMTAKGGSAGVAAAKTRLAPVTGTGLPAAPPPAGSTFVSSDGVKLEPIKTAGATTSAEDCRPLRLMVSAASGIFEHYLTGDPSTGNLATAQSMERPMELQFKNRQQFWGWIFYNILQYVIDQAIRSGKLPGEITTDEDGEEVAVLPEEMTRDLSIVFPDILEHDVQQQVQAIISAATLDGKPLAGTIMPKDLVQQLLQVLNVDDIPGIMERMFPDGQDGLPKIPGQPAIPWDMFSPEKLHVIRGYEAMLQESLIDLKRALAAQKA